MFKNLYVQLKVTLSFTLKGDLQTELKDLLAWFIVACVKFVLMPTFRN